MRNRFIHFRKQESKVYYFLFFILFFSTLSFSQIGIGTTTPNASLEIVGKPTVTTEMDGIIAPKITGDQLALKTYGANQAGAIVYVTAVPSSASGQVVNINSVGYYFFDGTNNWVKLATGNTNFWGLSGGTGTNEANDFIGTTDNQDFVTKTNGSERMRVTKTGNIGVGTGTPTSKFQINGSVSKTIHTVSSSTTLTDAHHHVLCDTSGGGFTLTLPLASSCIGREYIIKIIDDSNNTLTFSQGLKEGISATNITSINSQSTIKIQSDGTEWWIIE